MSQGLRCACGAPAQWRCTRLTEKYIQVPLARLRIGDKVCRNNEWTPKPGSHGEVIAIQELRPGLVEVSIAIHRKTQPPRFKSVTGSPVFVMRAARPIPCGASLCDTCAQDPGDPHHYCPEHWIIRSMELAA